MPTNATLLAHRWQLGLLACLLSSNATAHPIGPVCHHGPDAEVRRLVQLSEALGHLRALPQWQRPAPADLVRLQEVASSGTASARRACHTLRRYVPACPCRLPEEGKPAGGKTLAVSSAVGTTVLGAPYPNPTSSEFRVVYGLSATDAAAIELRDGLGRLVYQQALLTTSGEAHLPVGALANGLYTCLVVVNGRVMAARRVAVQH